MEKEESIQKMLINGNEYEEKYCLYLNINPRLSVKINYKNENFQAH